MLSDKDYVQHPRIFSDMEANVRKLRLSLVATEADKIFDSV